jgi:hypothetical protein
VEKVCKNDSQYQKKKKNAKENPETMNFYWIRSQEYDLLCFSLIYFDFVDNIMQFNALFLDQN